MSNNSSKQALDILKEVGAITTDSHIVLTTGRHTDAYLNLDMLMPHTEESSEMGRLFAEKYRNVDIDIVAGPAVGGIILSQWVAYHLSKLKGKEILSVFAEKDLNKNQVIERGFDKFIKGKKVLVVEDFTTTGGSVKSAAQSVQAAGGNIVEICVIVNREPDRVNSQTIGMPFTSLGVLKIDSWAEEECPLCAKNIPINTELGHGKEFLAKKNKTS
ncbi:phosphoribosyltransferase [Candidatus Roizmanbacteria bacterium]|nr:phosphoribosyltransferase [Candidatus Roizmanbacteria bacterium]